MSSSPFTPKSTAEEVATVLKDEIVGKNVFLVGCTINSLGAEFFRVIAPYAKTIWVAGRSPERLQAAIDAGLKTIPTGGSRPIVHLVELDTSVPESIRNAAAKVNGAADPIDVLVFNQMITPTEVLQRSADGHELQLAGNYLGTFLLASLLLPRLRQAGKGARLVAVSSISHFAGDIRWDDPDFKIGPEEYTLMNSYGQSKLALILFAKELANRLANEGILAYSLRPGSIITNAAYGIPKEFWAKYDAILPDGSFDPIFFDKTIPEGVATYVAAAFDPAIREHSGSYLVDSAVHNDMLAPAATDEAATRLWALSEELVGIKFL